MSGSPLLDPSVLFFVLGVCAGLIRSNLEIPAAIARFLSLYLLMALGLKGGFALSVSGIDGAILRDLGLAVLLAILVPLAGFALLKRFVPPLDALGDRSDLWICLCGDLHYRHTILGDSVR